MKYVTEDKNDIGWVRNYTEYDRIKEEMDLLMHKDKFDELCEHFCDEDGNCDMDALYDALAMESAETLEMVGLHLTLNTASVDEILAAWEKSTGRRIITNGGDVCGLEIYFYDDGAQTLSFETLDEDGEVETIELWDDEILKLLGYGNKIYYHGRFDTYDTDTAVFEMW